jgi:hypothetical protein
MIAPINILRMKCRFEMQAHLLMVVHHRNLVSLLGYCDEGEKKALIYEYMANGNLQQQLSGIYHQRVFKMEWETSYCKLKEITFFSFFFFAVTNKCILKWNERLQIAMDAAHGLQTNQLND